MICISILILTHNAYDNEDCIDLFKNIETKMNIGVTYRKQLCCYGY